MTEMSDLCYLREPRMIRRVFYPWVMYILTARITEAFGLPKPSLFFDYKVMLLPCPLRVN